MSKEKGFQQMYPTAANIWCPNHKTDITDYKENQRDSVCNGAISTGISLEDGVPNIEIRKRTELQDVIQAISKLKWN